MPVPSCREVLKNMPKIPMLGVRLFDPDASRYKLTSRFTVHLVRLRQATVEAAKSLSPKELEELVKSSAIMKSTGSNAVLT